MSLLDLYYNVLRCPEPTPVEPVACEDPIVQKVLDSVARRSKAGMSKYGVTMMRPDVDTIQWLRHAQEEALDLAVYLERVIHDLSQPAETPHDVF